ncbi:Cof-type HAD-IIB family hydrolase [Lachnoclostridium sp. Marseille-P6806]|uniref:Cof-type HAD-IIB family hydrolase n=1 Tax=Lachnoclostridium sp. Marseille-P6806 TaxID=2364793 RepID=UPI0013EF0B66|nr:Cof-type HAD-IIB family hydrolase [Lachnoclostridium sp. Marseille-P6806]
MHAVDLHVHSTFSDGTLTPAELVAHARDLGLSAFALTDHDTTDGIEEAQRAARGTGVEVIPGIEFSTEYHGRDIHVLGYYFRCDSPGFQERIHEFADARDLRNRKMCRLLCEAGLPVPYEGLTAENPGAVITRAHFAAYMEAHGIVKSRAEAFDRYIGDHCKYFVPRAKISPAMAVRFIREFGGAAVLAHPLQYQMGKEALSSLVAEMKEAGMCGLECIYSKYSPAETEELRRLAEAHGLLVTGGSDFHGANKRDLEMGTGYCGKLFVPETVLLALKHHVFHISPETKLFFADLDGTLLNSEKHISPATRDALNHWAAAGNRLVLSSGRTLFDMQMVRQDNLLQDFPGLYLCACNGAELYDCGSEAVIFHEGLPFDAVRKIVQLADECGVYIQSYNEAGIVARSAEKETEFYQRWHRMPLCVTGPDLSSGMSQEPCKCLAIALNAPEKLERLRRRVSDELAGTASAFYSNQWYLEIVSVHAGKGAAVQRICRMLGLPVSSSIAAGDSENDISMLREAGLGIAMCNGIKELPELAAAADIITRDDNDHDGLVPVLEARMDRAGA